MRHEDEPAKTRNPAQRTAAALPCPQQRVLLREHAGEQEERREEELPEVGVVLHLLGLCPDRDPAPRQQGQRGEQRAEAAEEHHQRHHLIQALPRVLPQHQDPQEEHQASQGQVQSRQHQE